MFRPVCSVIFIGIALTSLLVGCGGAGTDGLFATKAKFLNAASSAQTVELRAVAAGQEVVVGSAIVQGVTPSVTINTDVAGGLVGQVTFKAKVGGTDRAELAAAVTIGSHNTVIYATPLGGQAQPVLKVFPQDQTPNPAGQFRFNLINMATNLFQVPIDVYFLEAGASPQNQNPFFANIGLYGGSPYGTIPSIPAGARLAVTRFGQKVILKEIPFPNNSFTASGTFSIILTDLNTDDTQITLVDNSSTSP